jgi:AcrR family transcriptional regulator
VADVTPSTRSSPARERLLRTASALFYAEGVHRVGVDRVVTAAEVTRATFYRHFPSKEDLVVAYLQGIHDATRAYLGDATGVALLRRLVDATGEELCRPRYRGCPFINAAAEHPDPQDPVHGVVVAHRGWLTDVARDAFAAAGHPAPDAAAGRFVMLRDGAMVAGYLADGAAAAADLHAGLDELLAAAR